MSRLPKFDEDQFLESARRLIAAEGPSAATIGAVARETRAPTGSLYHRFRSRDTLVGEVWLQAATAFQNGYFAVLREDDAPRAGLRAVRYFVHRVGTRLPEARTLLLYRREDFIGRGWPASMERRAAALREQMTQEVRSFAHRSVGRTDQRTLRMVTFALLEAPLAAVRQHVQANEPPPASVDLLVAATYRAVMRLVGVSLKKERA